MDSQQVTKLFCCPICKKNLTRTARGFQCVCRKEPFLIKDDIPLLLPKLLPYPGEASIAAVLSAMKQDVPWRKAVYDFISGTNPHLYQIITNETRTAAHFLFNLTPENLVLDVGAGHGTFAMSLARRTRVVALDAAWHHLEFMKLRAEEDGVENVSIVGGDALHLPFRDQIFDLITMNGVLEWVPLKSPETPPWEDQLQALQECRRVLKPGGSLFIGIENSHAIRYFLGHPDDHTGLPHVSYLSRDQANRVSLALLGEPYETHTYTADEYRNLFIEAGFSPSTISFSIPLPDYNTMDMILPINRPDMAAISDHVVDRSFERLGSMRRIRSWHIDVTDPAHANAYFITATA